jgi:pyrroloquinoline-quinone synthase
MILPVVENLAEEENPAQPHPQLWRDFAAALESAQDITTSPALPGTQNVAHLREICTNRSVVEAVAALYAYESQVPEIAATKIDGLNRFYGISDRKGTAYFGSRRGRQGAPLGMAQLAGRKCRRQ